MGTATVGGFIYRGSALPELYGRWSSATSARSSRSRSGKCSSTPPASRDALWPMERLIQVDQRLHTLGEDAEGELYLLTTAQGIPVGHTGKVWKLVPAKAR